MEGAKILVCDPVHGDGVEMLREAGYEVDLKTDISDEELVKIVGGYDALVVRSRTKVTAEVLEAADRLRVVARSGVGLDNIDVEEAKNRGVEVVNSPEAPTNAVAELVLGLMLSLARSIPEADASMKRGEWIKSRLRGFELRGKTLGILGLGTIGKQVAKRAKAFDPRIIYNRRNRLPEAEEKTLGVEYRTFDQLLGESDILTVHVPLTDSTRGMIGREELNKMKYDAYLINASRGGIVDEGALKEALMEGKLAGAALDVFEEEPPGDTSLSGLKNVVATPHIGAATVEAQRANSTIVAEKIIKILSERKPRSSS